MGCCQVGSRALSGAVALAIVFASLPARGEPASPGFVIAEPEAQAHFERGMQAFNQGRYHDAIVALDAAYAIESHPQLIYARAQARRLAGECGSALKLYEYFLATSPPEAQARDAAMNIERCSAALSIGAPPPEARPAPEPAPEPEGPAPPPVVEIPPPPPVRKDIAGGVLTGVGAATTGLGLGLLLGAVARSKTLTSTSHSQFDQRYQQLRATHLAGAVVLGVGVGLLVSGVTRYALVARKRRQLERAR
jgi:hypothetical protein